MSIPIVDNFMFELTRTRLNAATQFWLVFGEVKGLVEFGNTAPAASSTFFDYNNSDGDVHSNSIQAFDFDIFCKYDCYSRTIRETGVYYLGAAS